MSRTREPICVRLAVKLEDKVKKAKSYNELFRLAVQFRLSSRPFRTVDRSKRTSGYRSDFGPVTEPPRGRTPCPAGQGARVGELDELQCTLKIKMFELRSRSLICKWRAPEPSNCEDGDATGVAILEVCSKIAVCWLAYCTNFAREDYL